MAYRTTLIRPTALMGMGVDPQKNRGDPSPPSTPSFPLPIPLEVAPLNPARVSGGVLKLPSRVWGTAPAEIEFGAF